MTDQAQTTRVVPAGWYQDPASASQVRWWNGLSWTEHTAEKPPEAGQAALTAGASSAGASSTGALSTEARIAEARKLEREFGISTAEHAVITADADVANPAYPSTGSIETVKPAATSSHRVRTTTIPAFVLGLYPIFAVIVSAIAAYVYLYVTASPLVFGAAAAIWLLSLIWAIADQRTLASRGLRSTSPAWALISPIVYLVIRRLRVPGSAPLVLCLALTVVTAAAVPVLLATGALQPLQTALGVQQALQEGLVSTGKAQSVTCPASITDTSVGSFVTCDVTLDDGTHTKALVSFDDLDGRFSYTLTLR